MQLNGTDFSILADAGSFIIDTQQGIYQKGIEKGRQEKAAAEIDRINDTILTAELKQYERNQAVSGLLQEKETGKKIVTTSLIVAGALAVLGTIYIIRSKK